MKTAELNGNIYPIQKGLSNETTKRNIFVHKDGKDIHSTNYTFRDQSSSNNYQVSGTIETITIDDFVKERKLERVDFIKSDIEGFERYMLQGAQETLKNFAPKLALCTYHLPDDPQVMTNLIMQANPHYNIVYGKMKLFASVK